MEADVVEFYEKAKSDPAFAAELDVLKAKWKESQPSREAFAADLIEAAKKYGITLTPDDFAEKKEELSDEELKGAVGGRASWDIAVTPDRRYEKPPLGIDPLRPTFPPGGGVKLAFNL
jgi:hypothetical protein